jgi:hypothetical protein
MVILAIVNKNCREFEKMGPGMEGAFFGGVPPFFMLFFIIVISVIVITIIRSVIRYSKNAAAPQLQTRGRVVAKRMHVSNHTSMNNDHPQHHSSTQYYVTFETDNGERMELVLKGREYGLLAEGDEGILTYQGEWFIDFKRSTTVNSLV